MAHTSTRLQSLLIALLFAFAMAGSTLTRKEFNMASRKLYVGYYASWIDTETTDGTKLGLANLPAYVNVVNIVFISPNTAYAGNLDLTKTGLEFVVTGTVLKKAIDTLRKNNPKTLILISIGGGSAGDSWNNLNEKAIAQFVKDFGLDGVDIDFEPTDKACAFKGNQIACATDAQFKSIVTRMRAALPAAAYVSIAVTGFGAFGEGIYGSGSRNVPSDNGYALNLLKSDIGKKIDIINIMAYDSGNGLNGTKALLSYKNYYKGQGKITLGVEVPPEAAGGHVLSIDEVTKDADFINKNNGGGMMIWTLQKKT